MGPLDSKKKLHLISWKKISTPKKDDAFDLFAIEAKNTVLLANSTKEKKKKKTLWGRVLSHKYTNQRGGTNPNFKNHAC